MTKSQQMKQLINELKNDKACETISPPMINHYALHDLIPNKWFDWENRSDAKIMLIGQDWGPYTYLKKYVERYQLKKDSPNFSYNDFLYEAFSSRTEKFILKTIEETYVEKHGKFNKTVLNNIFFTVAVLFTRTGNKFRGNENFNERKSTEISYPYLVKQIEIVSPNVIITLGNLALRQVDRYFGLGIAKQNLTQLTNELKKTGSAIKKNGVVIIPAFHPAAHISPKIQTKIWQNLWQYI